MAFVGNGEITNVTPVSCPPGASSELHCAVDNDELPNGETFFYMLKVDFSNGGKSGGSVPQGIVAVNNAPDADPVLVADPYTMFWKTTLNAGVNPPGVLGSDPSAAGYDTDVDSPHTSLRAVLVLGSLSPSTSGALQCGTAASPSLCADGSFKFTPAGTFNGTVNFSYKANDGTWTDKITKSVTLLTHAGPTATATVPNHGYSTGMSITIAGANQTAYNGTKTITVTGPNTFTYQVSGNPATPATGVITAQNDVSVPKSADSAAVTVTIQVIKK
jgi:hypothetical protein